MPKKPGKPGKPGVLVSITGEPLPELVIPDDGGIRTDMLTPSYAEQEFRDELVRQGITYVYKRGSYLMQAADGGTPEEYEMGLLVDSLIARGAATIKDTSVDMVCRWLRLWTHDQQRITMDAVRDKIRYVDRAKGKEELRKWINAVCREGNELSEVIMEQWIWTNRVKLFRRPEDVVEHIMPVLQGKQKSGKTTAIRKLLDVIDPLWRKWDFSQILDERHHLTFKRCLVGYVEELAGGRDAAIDKLKGIITQPEAPVRLFHTQNIQVIPMLTNFIGDTNKTVKDVIKDETGARRFWEIRCKDKLDWEVLNDIDHAAIWGCVSEHDQAPVLASPHYDEISRLQYDKIRHRNSLEEWADEWGGTPGDVLVPLTSLYALYREYCRDAGLYSDLGRSAFSRAMKARGFEIKVARVNKLSTRCLLCTPPQTKA